jgi:hypothetical protein
MTEPGFDFWKVVAEGVYPASPEHPDGRVERLMTETHFDEASATAARDHYAAHLVSGGARVIEGALGADVRLAHDESEADCRLCVERVTNIPGLSPDLAEALRADTERARVPVPTFKLGETERRFDLAAGAGETAP